VPVDRQRNVVRMMTILYLVLVGVWAANVGKVESTWVTMLLAYMPQQLFAIIPVLLLLWTLKLREWRIGSWNLGTLVFLTFTLLGFNIPAHLVSVPAAGQPVRVMTFNIHHTAAGATRIAEFVMRQKPDIVCFQEANPGDWKSEVPAELIHALPGYHIAKFRELATLSRYPIISQCVHRMQERTGRAILETVIDVNGHQVAVLNTHLSTATGGSIFHREVSLGAYMHGVSDVRRYQTEKLLLIAADLKIPTIVMGDFNTPPRGVVYDRMRSAFTDAFRRKGWGFGYTYSRRMPVMRIDYIWAGRGIEVKDVSVPKVSPSDHRPVIADLVILDSERKSRL
jgi:vancomycin resistance protein VanJ